MHDFRVILVLGRANLPNTFTAKTALRDTKIALKSYTDRLFENFKILKTSTHRARSIALLYTLSGTISNSGPGFKSQNQQLRTSFWKAPHIPVYTLIYKKLCMAQGAIRIFFPRFGGFKFYFRQSFNDLISDFAFRAPQAKKNRVLVVKINSKR